MKLRNAMIMTPLGEEHDREVLLLWAKNHNCEPEDPENGFEFTIDEENTHHGRVISIHGKWKMRLTPVDYQTPSDDIPLLTWSTICGWCLQTYENGRWYNIDADREIITPDSWMYLYDPSYDELWLPSRRTNENQN